MSSLKDLALKLLNDGPHKQEKTPRRVRGLFNGSYVLDTTDARHVWEHPYYPQFYVPASSLKAGILTKDDPVNEEESAFLATLKAGGKSTDRVLSFEKGSLAGLVRVEFGALDAWFEEDQLVYGPHPKDPYKRIDILPSSRKVTSKIDNVVIAESSNNMFLYETMLKPRYYMPPSSVRSDVTLVDLSSSSQVQWQYLRPSDTTTMCPYKGVANYYDVVVNGKEHKDAVWWYKYPTSESAQIAGHMCFYDGRA